MKNKNLNLRWILIVGGFGFLIGFVGPMIFAPNANQGPLLGILITGPLGSLLGTFCWILSWMLGWSYELQVRVAAACCGLIACGILFAAVKPKPEWPGRIYELQVTNCAPSKVEGEIILDTIVLKERQIKKETDLFKKKTVYSSGAITYPKPTIVRNSFYAPGACAAFPAGFEGTYYVTNHPQVARDKAVLEALPDFAKGL